MKKRYYYFISLILFLMLPNIVFSQNKEIDKLKSLIEKGNLEKAQTYCDKVTAPMAQKNAAKFYALLANAYYRDKDYLKAAEMVEKSEDFKLAAKLAKEFDNVNSAVSDIDIAIKMYKKGKEPDLASALLFGQGKYEESALTTASANLNMKFGDSLFNQGKEDESIFFYKRAKNKGQKFCNEKVLELCYKKRDYKLVYTIQNFNESEFKMPIQGSVIDKMLEYNEPISFIRNFMDSLEISKNKQDEIIIEGFIHNGLFDKAEAFCLEHQNSELQICLGFLADKTSEAYPEVSASVNIKLGRTFIAQNQLTTYLIETAKAYNNKWDKEPIDNKDLEAFWTKTKLPVQKCGHDYCKDLLHALNMCKIKADDLSKNSKNQAAEYTRATIFLKQVAGSYCK